MAQGAQREHLTFPQPTDYHIDPERKDLFQQKQVRNSDKYALFSAVLLTPIHDVFQGVTLGMEWICQLLVVTRDMICKWKENLSLNY